jgi:ubiquinone/menaquinone biosynthesis C-methylase UbiE
LRRFGYSPETLGWGKRGRQEIRFGVLVQPILEIPGSSVLDAGCGFADLYDYLVAQGWKGRYCGIDIVPGLLQVARERHPELDLREVDITASDVKLGSHDFVVASGMFNARLKRGDNLKHIEHALLNMRRIAKAAVCVDFMSTYVDYQHPEGWHTDPAWALALGKKLSRRVMLRHDYMPYEFALIIYTDDTISPRNVFNAAEKAAKMEELL